MPLTTATAAVGSGLDKSKLFFKQHVINLLDSVPQDVVIGRH